jgi:hypothetical protein
MMQLPFRPAIHHQWTVALLAESLKYQKEISDLMIMETPTTLHPALTHLKNMSIVLHNYAQCHLEHYFECCENNWKFESGKGFISRFLPDLLPTLKFVLSDECKSIIKALKRLAWSNKGIHQTGKWRSVLEQTEEMRVLNKVHIYSQAFWECNFPYFHLFSYNMKIKNITWNVLCDPKISADGNIHALKRLVMEKIIKPGRLSDVSIERIFEAVEVSHRMLFKAMAHYNEYIGKLINFQAVVTLALSCSNYN